MHQLKNCSCQRCSCCLNFKWRPLWEIFLSFCISYILSRFLLVVWGLIFWPATSFHGLISLNMVRVVRETAKKQREQTRLISHCKDPILCWLHLKELADMCTSFTLWSLYSFLSNTVGNSSVNKNHSFTDVSSGDQLKLSKWTNTRNVENDPGIIMLLWPNLWEICVFMHLKFFPLLQKVTFLLCIETRQAWKASVRKVGVTERMSLDSE